MDRGVPRSFIELLKCWYEKCTVQVRWNMSFSNVFSIKAGVRQGGVLSPALFAVYINIIIESLSKSGLGCIIN